MRLTPNKVKGWHARIERARRTIENVDREVGEHVTRTKGGDLTAVLELRTQLRGCKSYLADADAVALQMAEREDRKAAAR